MQRHHNRSLWRALEADIEAIFGVVAYAALFIATVAMAVGLGLGAAAFGFWLGSL